MISQTRIEKLIGNDPYRGEFGSVLMFHAFTRSFSSLAETQAQKISSSHARNVLHVAERILTVLATENPPKQTEVNRWLRVAGVRKSIDKSVGTWKSAGQATRHARDHFVKIVNLRS